MNHPNQPGLRPVPMTVFPTLGSLQEVIDLANSKLPISDQNEMFSLLMSYHNTLLKEIHGQAHQGKDPRVPHRAA
jgi:hypothetical protein